MAGPRIEIADLTSFIVPNVRPTGRELGKGAYGSVEEVEIPGAVCAAKKIHTEFLKLSRSDGRRHMISKFTSECRLMSTLRHPHIVQFLGVCYLPGSRLPSLVMERLETNLHELLETTPNLPLTIKQSILLDVARGLLYLHSQSPPIIHRDLTARNVLLNSAMVAKIADLSVARIVDLQPNQLATMTQGPGNAVYMPPEAMGEHTQYNSSLDIFSFGNLALFTLTQEFIGLKRLKAATYTDPKSGKISALSEIERRGHGFHTLYRWLGDKNTFVKLTQDCLQNRPTDRPSAADLVDRIKVISSNTESPSKLELMRQLSSKKNKIKLLQEQNSSLQQQTTAQQQQAIVQQQQLEKKDSQLKELQGLLSSEKEQMQSFEKRLDEILAQVWTLQVCQ